MLAEFALTPSIFDEAAQPDPESWREQLRELGASMFPRTGAWPVMVSDLYAGSWHKIAVGVVKRISDAKARRLCEDLLTNIAKSLVFRPAVGDWPADEAVSWGQEAIDSQKGEPIDRIVACKPSHEVLAKGCRFIRCIDEVGDSGFWKEISSGWSPPMKIADQISTIRKLCVHSEFLALVTPHIYGGSDDETDFVVALIKSALSRLKDYLPSEIDIHTEASSDSATSARLKGNITRALRSCLGPGQQVRLYLWPRLLDRYLIAGVYTKMSDGSRKRSPRWGVSMQHIARKADEREPKDPTSWYLLNSGQLFDQFNRYCSHEASGFLSSDVVAVT